MGWGPCVLKEAGYYARMAWYYGRYVSTPAIHDPEPMLRGNLERRAENFLELVRTGVFENPSTPYHRLMRLAGCSFGDLQQSVHRDGIEPTLEQLRRQGVYLTHAELKGAPVRRHGQEIPNDPTATSTPNLPGGIEAVSSGSRGRGMATPSSNAFRRYREAYHVLWRKEHGIHDRSVATVYPFLPDPLGLVNGAGIALSGLPVERWFAVGQPLNLVDPYWLVTNVLVAEARLLGCRLPFPTLLRHGDFAPVARWIAATKQRGRAVFLRGNVSSLTRVCSAALEAGLDVAGTIVMTSGETLTDGKQRLMESAGVRPYSAYVASEMGMIGMSCSGLTGNSVHLMSDSVAAIVHRRPAPFTDREVDSLLLTSLNPLASRILINVELEDAGTLELARCDCVFSRMGFRTVIRNLHSFGKLTGHGLTLAGGAFLEILDERLPLRFGGAPGDYQLVEQEGGTQIEFRLRVSPRAGAPDAAAVRAFFLDEVRKIYGGAISIRTWDATSSLQVEVAEPYRTRSGKVYPLHLSAVHDSHAHR